ncbi:hypothetical protein [Streptomyces phaeochromogenes]|uniref:hypothetical protein n=1 Tax=Streptomyces phaeochromogenes TaxID=1923 RepID=UPI002E1166DA|nr:hypothetical protein OG437_01120 [Streptomyces phaeochromogenes]
MPLREQAINLTVEDEDSPLYGADADADDIVVRAGRLHLERNPARGESYRQTSLPRSRRRAC